MPATPSAYSAPRSARSARGILGRSTGRQGLLRTAAPRKFDGSGRSNLDACGSDVRVDFGRAAERAFLSIRECLDQRYSYFVACAYVPSTNREGLFRALLLKRQFDQTIEQLRETNTGRLRRSRQEAGGRHARDRVYFQRVDLTRQSDDHVSA